MSDAAVGVDIPVNPGMKVSRSSRQVLARNVSLLAGGQLVSWSATLAWTVLVPRKLGAGQIGVYTLSQAATGILLVVVGVGLRPLLVREIAADRTRAPQLIGTSIILRAFLSVPALAATLLMLRLAHLSHDETLAVLLGWVICLCLVVPEPILAAFQAIEEMRYLAYSTMLTATTVSLVSIVLALVGVRAVGLLLVAVAMLAISTVLTLVWARGYFHIEWRLSPRLIWELLVESLPYSTFAIFFTLYLWIDSLMLGLMTPSSVLGWYGLPTRLFGSLLVLPVVISTALLPQLVHAHKAGGDALFRKARPAMELLLVVSLPVCVGTILVAKPLVNSLYGRGFSGSIPVLALLALCVPPMYLNIMANQVMIAAKRQVVWTRLMVLASVINPVLNLLLIRHFQASQGNGAVGAALAMVVTELVLAIIALALVRHAFALSSVVRVLKSAAATSVMAVPVVFALRLGLAAGIAAGAVSFSLIAAVLRVLSAPERKLLRDLPGRLIRRRQSAPL
jgi:O-antigen/teichoic acid export membrane protein